jgi:hypothetical protein
MQKSCLYTDAGPEAERFLWIESEKAGRDLGEQAVREWVRRHWPCYLRSCWAEHLQGKKFRIELDRNDFGLLRLNPVLLERILDRLAAGQGNLDVIVWAHDCGIAIEEVLRFLEVLDVTGRRLAHSFGPFPPFLVNVNPAWLTWNRSTVVQLARSIREDQAFDLLPILGDALEEAGCSEPLLLEHCRAGGHHAGWCWVISLLLEQPGLQGKAPDEPLPEEGVVGGA